MSDPAVLAGLMHAHGVLSTQEESLACMLGDGGGGGSVGAARPSRVLLARYSLASCLRCYFEAAEPWRAAPMRDILCAGQVAQEEGPPLTGSMPPMVRPPVPHLWLHIAHWRRCAGGTLTGFFSPCAGSCGALHLRLRARRHPAQRVAAPGAQGSAGAHSCLA